MMFCVFCSKTIKCDKDERGREDATKFHRHMENCPNNPANMDVCLSCGYEDGGENCCKTKRLSLIKKLSK